MTTSSRIFVGFALPEPQRVALQGLQRAIGARLANAQWVEPHLFHGTLAFLGDVPDTDLNRVCLAVASAAKRFRPIRLSLRSLGVFPNPTRPRVAWAGVDGPDLARLADLREAVAVQLVEAGFPPSDDRFTPHITLAYLKLRKGATIDVGPLIERWGYWSGGDFEVKAITTFSSTLTPDGRAYMPMASANLSGSKKS